MKFVWFNLMPWPYRPGGFAQIICVADTDEQAEELYTEHMLYFFNRCLHVHPGFCDPPGYRTINTIKAGELNQLRAENQKLFSNVTWKNLVDNGMVIAGSPDTVRERCEDMIKTLRLGTVFCLFHMGDMPDWKTRRSSELVARKVMPQLRDLWPQWKDDDRFWIKPYEDRVGPRYRSRERAGRRGSPVSAPSVALGEHTLVTRRGIESRVLEAGVGAGRPLVYFHGAGGLYPREPLLERLAQNRHVVAPEWPGYGNAPGEEKLEDMLDLALHGWDIIEALNLDPTEGRPDLLGHSMGE